LIRRSLQMTMSVLSSSGDKSSRSDFRIPASFTSSNRLPSLCLSTSIRRLLSHTAMCPAPNYACHKIRSAQPTGLEFGHRWFDLLAASPLLNPDLSDSRHAANASKTRPRWVALTDTPEQMVTAAPGFRPLKIARMDRESSSVVSVALGASGRSSSHRPSPQTVRGEVALGRKPGH